MRKYREQSRFNWNQMSEASSRIPHRSKRVNIGEKERLNWSKTTYLSLWLKNNLPFCGGYKHIVSVAQKAPVERTVTRGSAPIAGSSCSGAESSASELHPRLLKNSDDLLLSRWPQEGPTVMRGAGRGVWFGSGGAAQRSGPRTHSWDSGKGAAVQTWEEVSRTQGCSNQTRATELVLHTIFHRRALRWRMLRATFCYFGWFVVNNLSEETLYLSNRVFLCSVDYIFSNGNQEILKIVKLETLCWYSSS